jgi:hypothetical protein
MSANDGQDDASSASRIEDEGENIDLNEKHEHA